MRSHLVAVLVLADVVPLDLGIPASIFGKSRGLPYRMIVCGIEPEIDTTTGFSVRVPGTLEDVRRADTLIVPGYTNPTGTLSSKALDAIAHVHSQGRRVVSICSGAFALAEAGVLDGRRATTHWSRAEELATKYPRIDVDPDVLYVDEGSVLTSAGVSAGIDLCLHIVRRDLGAKVANVVARSLVAAPHRDGGQSQFIDTPVPTMQGSSQSDVRVWALANLERPITIRDLARRAGTSERTFARRFVAETGCSPLQWLVRARVDLARGLLETGTFSVEQVAVRTGMGTAINLRIHFRKIVGTTPTAYRRTFQGLDASA